LINHLAASGPDNRRWLKGWIMERGQLGVRALQLQSTVAAGERVRSALPTCPSHPGSRVRRYRSLGHDGPGVYPQCVPLDGGQPHLLAWNEAPPVPVTAPEPAVLSASELAVLEDAANGLTVTETALRRLKGRETVKTQRRSILLKLGARNIAQAVAMMIGDGLIATTDNRATAARG
jgi:DNA-binding CsgD family transcriptional regulator